MQGLLSDPDPLVRASAAGASRGLPSEQRLAALEPLLRDPRRTVREAAATALPDARPGPGTPAATALAEARAEWQRALSLRLDFPETHLQLGGAALARRDFVGAMRAFGKAAAMDPQLVSAWVMVVRIALAIGETATARQALSEGLAANPGDPSLLAQEAVRR